MGKPRRLTNVQLLDHLTQSGICYDMPTLGVFKSKKQSKNAKQRFEHLMVLAKENPDRIFDLSECELYAVPNQMFGQCRVLLTESLLLHSNFLKSLKQGGKTTCLVSLRVLDLHNNVLTSLPSDLGVLGNLQVLNVERNKLTELPDSIGELKMLQSLLVKDNLLNSLPITISTMSSLRTLDVSGTNKVYYLPKTLCQVRTLEVLVLSNPSLMEYPSPTIAAEGLEAIQKFICKDMGLEYIPPSHQMLQVLDSSASTSTAKQVAQMNTTLYQSSMDQYQRSKDERLKQQLELERSMAKSQREQAYLATKARDTKAKEQAFLRKDIEVFERSISEQQKKTDRERQEMMKKLKQVEHEASHLVNKLLNMNIAAKKREFMLEEMERERLEQEERFKVTQEDIDQLRKQETLAAMESVLADNDRYVIMIDKYLGQQDHITRQAQQTLGADNKQIEDALKQQQMNQGVLVDQILLEEEFQKEAFAVLKLQRDAVQARLIDQIGQIQNELIQLTQIEAKRNMHKIEQDKQTLWAIRNNLTELLVQLLKEKDQREEMVKLRLIEMEEQREDDQIDFWLVQYQKLLDTKPQVLIQKEDGVDPQIVKLLKRSDAAHHLPEFARHKITMENIFQLDHDKLRTIGVFETGLRDNILREIESITPEGKQVDLREEVSPPQLLPSTSSVPVPLVAPSAPAVEEGESSDNECVVCLDRTSDTLFLPCGHVCSCNLCSTQLNMCPMCRSDISQKFKFYRS